MKDLGWLNPVWLQPYISAEESQFTSYQSSTQASGGVQPNVNSGGSAHQQKFTEAEIAVNYEIGTSEHLKYYRSLHNAAKRGDWESAKSFIEMDPNALAATITVDSKTVDWHNQSQCKIKMETQSFILLHKMEA
ncbi:hypothetical protein QYF36_012034 [Acer negundo]|nr:hypothetical protein QYF36_012034 [Acer negundo]